jgi:colanic acid biosynthesis glycosyl transferase WcaI
MKPKRILVVCQHFWPEAFRINDFCYFLIEKGCEVDVLCGIPNYPEGKFYDGYSYLRNRKQCHKQINIRRAFEIPRGNNSNIRIFLNFISFPLSSLFHIPRLVTKKYDKIVIFEYSPVMMAIAGIITGKITKTETTMWALDLWPENLFSVIKVKNPILKKVATIVSHWHYKNVDKLVVLSEKMKQRLQSVTNLPEDKFLILPQACEKIYEQDIYDKKLATKYSNGFNIVFTGNLSPAQSFGTIIEAAKKLKVDGLNDINWIIVGDGMSRKWLEKEVKKAGLTNSFHFEGLKPKEEIPKYTTIADILIGCLVKSDLLEATIPSKVTSYIAAGRPIVLAIDGEARDLINSTIKCGFAGPTEDAMALANNIKKIYELPQSQRNAMGQRGREYHFKHFERNIVLSKFYDFICL